MKKFAATVAICLALVGVSSIAAHADTFNFSATGTGFESSGTLTMITDATTPGVFDVTSITGEVNGVAITGLMPASYNAGSPQTNNSGAFIYDNLVYASSPFLDYNGIGFNIGDAGYQGNFFFNAGSYEFLDSNGATTVLSEISAAPVAQTPEPSSLLLLGTGAMGAVGALRRRLLA